MFQVFGVICEVLCNETCKKISMSVLSVTCAGADVFLFFLFGIKEKFVGMSIAATGAEQRKKKKRERAPPTETSASAESED